MKSDFMDYNVSFFDRMRKWRSSFSHGKPVYETRPLPCYRPDECEWRESQEELERILTQNIIPFWYPEVVDSVDGGYRLNHDLHGKWRGPANKDLITQARTVWFFSRLSKTRYGIAEHLDAARHGFTFLQERMWDNEWGGFYWEVDSSGKRATKPDKHLCGQAFALYALCEYATASRDVSAKQLALELLGLLETHAHDSQHGGFREYFRRDWSFASRDLTGYVKSPPDIKLMSTHLHLMEAVTLLFRTTNDKLAGDRLLELIFIQLSSLMHKVHGTCTDQYHLDWTPLQTTANQRASYGHLLKTIWMPIAASAALGVSNGAFLNLHRNAFQQVLSYGFDRKLGGFYHSGAFGTKANRQEKVWWVQAEGLLCALEMYHLMAEETYWKCFSTTLDWVVKRQADWQHGDWHWQIGTDGKPSGDKARPWKGPYHNGRAMIRCLELLESDFKA